MTPLISNSLEILLFNPAKILTNYPRCFLNYFLYLSDIYIISITKVRADNNTP